MERGTTVQPEYITTSPPPPYYPPDASTSSVNPAVVHTQPTFNTSTTMVQNTSFIPVETTVVTASIVTPKVMGPVATPFVCPSCNNMIVTRVEASPTMKQHIFAALLCVVGFWPCACIPYCIASCRKADHFCPICRSYIGSYRG